MGLEIPELLSLERLQSYTSSRNLEKAFRPFASSDSDCVRVSDKVPKAVKAERMRLERIAEAKRKKIIRLTKNLATLQAILTTNRPKNKKRIKTLEKEIQDLRQKK